MQKVLFFFKGVWLCLVSREFKLLLSKSFFFLSRLFFFRRVDILFQIIFFKVMIFSNGFEFVCILQVFFLL